MKNLNKKQGISLIVLIITIIVIIILATAVIQQFSNNNPVEKAKEATFKNDVKTIQEELEMAKLNTYFEEESADVTIDNLKTAQNKYKEKFAVIDGKLMYVKSMLNSKEIKWAQELGLSASGYLLKDGKNGITIDNNGVLTNNWFNNSTGQVDYPDIGTELIIPSGVQKIGNSAFYWCREVTSISFPTTLKIIGDSAFWGCSSLENISIPSNCGLTSISDHAFYECKSLKKIELPNTITKIGSMAFYGCWNLSDINLPTSLKFIGSGAFGGCRNLKSIVIPSNLENISDHSFSSCSSLKTITIEGNARFSKTNIKKWFGEDTSIDDIVISGSGYISE